LPIAQRAYRDEEDYSRVRDLLIRLHGLNDNHHSWDLERWDYWLHFVYWLRYSNWRYDPAKEKGWEPLIRLWETDQGELVGVANPEEFGDLHLQVHPEYRFLEDEMVAWGEEHLAVEAKNGTGRRITTAVFEFDVARQELLARRGYRKTDDCGYTRRRNMNEPIPDAAPPAGYVVRSLEPGDNLMERCAVMAAAFRSPRADVDLYGKLQAAPGYRLDLDMVAIAPDGTFASCCIVWWDEENRQGTFEPVGTHRSYQRRGLGAAVMCEGLRRLRDLGATTAWVGAWTPPGIALYKSIGFTEADMCCIWEKAFQA